MDRYSREYIHDEVDNHRQVAQWWIEADEVDARIQELEEDIHALIGYSPRHCIDCVIDIDGVCTCGLNKLMAKYTAAEALKDT